MGKTKTKTTQVNKPIYSAEIGQAAGQQQAAYTQSQPMINQVSGNLANASNDLFAQYRNGGDPTVAAASGYLRDTIESDPTQNPYLQQQIDMTNDSVRNQVQASMGRRGLTGGSDYTNMIARSLAQNESGLRYNDYNNAENRRLQAAGMAPGIAQAGYLPLQMAAQTGQAGAMLPLQAGALNAASVGGLLGQYQDVKGTQTQKQGLGGMLGGLLGAGLSGWASGGFG